MPARASWKGFLKLSLVSVPVKAFTSTATSREIHLNQLHGSCNNRINYRKVCPEHGEVSNDEIVKGYEYDKDQYVIIDEEELDKLRTENDRSISIDGFVSSDALDPIYHSGKTYYLLPDGPVGQKPYALLVESMSKRKVNAVVQLVMSGKEQLAMVRPLDGMLVMSMLYLEEQIKSSSGFNDELVDQDLTEEEVGLTNTLIEASTIKKFDYGKYKDRYTAKLTELIQLKIEGKEVVQAPNPEEPKIINLMDALKKSVEQAQQSGASARSSGSTKKQAPSARSKKSTAKSTTKTAKRKSG